CRNRRGSGPGHGQRARRLLFFRGGAGRGPTGADGRAIDAPEVEVDQAALVQAELQRFQDAVEQAALAHLAEAVVDRLPLAVAVGQVAPGGARIQSPEDAVEDEAVVLPLATAPAGPWRKEGSEQLPLGVGKFVSFHP